MDNERLKGNILLLITSIVWGLAFVAQRVGGESMGAFAFNSIRFALGGFSLIPLMIHFHKKNSDVPIMESIKDAAPSGILAGSILFMAASFQQIGIMYTTVANTAFITGMYIILVPIIGLFIKQRINIKTWVACIIAIIGLYFLSVQEGLKVNSGDLLVLISAVFWSSHIIYIGFIVQKYEAIKISMIQFITCSILSGIASAIFEITTLEMIYSGLIPILYGGIMSVGVAYTLQVVGQKYAKASHAAIILSLEVVFGAIGSAIILGEILSFRSYMGALLMLVGMILSQIKVPKKWSRVREALEKEV